MNPLAEAIRKAKLKEKRVKVPRARSPGEELFAVDLKSRGIAFEREVHFAPGRKWRVDFLISQGVLRPILVEIEGGVYSRGRHTRGSGYSADLDKYNAAAVLGYLVLRYSTEMVKSGQAGKEIAALLESSTNTGNLPPFYPSHKETAKNPLLDISAVSGRDA